MMQNPPPTKKRIRVLIVESDKKYEEDQHSFFSIPPVWKTLENEVEVIAHFNSGIEALRHVLALEPDIVLVSISLSDMNAISLVWRLDKIAPTLPVIIMSHANDPQNLRRGIMNGVRSFVMRPLHPNELLDHLTELMKNGKYGSLVPAKIEAAKAYLERHRQMHIFRIGNYQGTAKSSIDHAIKETNFAIELMDSSETAQESYERILFFEPDAVLIDTNITDMNAVDFAAKLKAEMPNLPIIITGAITPEDRERATQHGIHDFMMHPLKSKELIRKLHKKRIRVLLVEPRTYNLATNRDEIPKLSPVWETLRNEVELVGHFTSGIDALRHIQALKPDIVLIDVNIRDINAVSLAWKLQKVAPSLPVCLISISYSTDMFQSGTLNGVDDFLNRPLDSDEVLSTFTNVLENGKYDFQKVINSHLNGRRPIHIFVICDCGGLLNQEPCLSMYPAFRQLHPYVEMMESSGTGQAGYEFVRFIEPDAVLIDTNITDMNAVELATKLKTEMPNLPIILTGDITPEDRERAMQHSIHDFMSHPLDGEELLHRLHKLVLNTNS